MDLAYAFSITELGKVWDYAWPSGEEYDRPPRRLWTEPDFAVMSKLKKQSRFACVLELRVL